jgi:uncharacterized membrane protein YphA (DoxX/SURF4 family)
MFDKRLDTSWWALRLAYGLVPIVAGLDKFTNLLTDWPAYLSPLALRVLPFSGATFMHIVGVIEIVAGIIVLSKAAHIGAYIVSAWLVCIALNLVATGHYDVAVRDIVMAIGSFVLARMTEVRHRAQQPAGQSASLSPAHPVWAARVERS